MLTSLSGISSNRSDSSSSTEFERGWGGCALDGDFDDDADDGAPPPPPSLPDDVDRFIDSAAVAAVVGGGGLCIFSRDDDSFFSSDIRCLDWEGYVSDNASPMVRCISDGSTPTSSSSVGRLRRNS